MIEILIKLLLLHLAGYLHYLNENVVGLMTTIYQSVKKQRNICIQSLSSESGAHDYSELFIMLGNGKNKQS